MKPRSQRKASQENRPTEKKFSGSHKQKSVEHTAYTEPVQTQSVPKKADTAPAATVKTPTPKKILTEKRTKETAQKKTSKEQLEEKSNTPDTSSETLYVPENVTPRTGTRLNKTLADAGICSRRKADELITEGAVTVDGALGKLGTRVFQGQTVCVYGKPIKTDGATPLLYIVLHKPIQTVSTVSDPEGRPTVLDILPEQYTAARLYPVGRLDYFSEGLLLLTNDGELTHKLTHPSHELTKIYHVLVRENPTEEQLQSIRAGMTLAEGEKLAPVAAKILARTDRGTDLELRLQQGINRQIRRMCRDLGLTILTLRRVAQGPVLLGTLACGEARHLSRQELSSLKKAVGLA